MRVLIFSVWTKFRIRHSSLNRNLHKQQPKKICEKKTRKKKSRPKERKKLRYRNNHGNKTINLLWIGWNLENTFFLSLSGAVVWEKKAHPAKCLAFFSSFSIEMMRKNVLWIKMKIKIKTNLQLNFWFLVDKLQLVRNKTIFYKTNMKYKRNTVIFVVKFRLCSSQTNIPNATDAMNIECKTLIFWKNWRSSHRLVKINVCLWCHQ